MAEENIKEKKFVYVKIRIFSTGVNSCLKYQY